MKKIFLLSSVILLTACAHEKSGQSKDIALSFSKDLVEKSQKKKISRMPASVMQMEDFSGRRVYFTTLYSQYLDMSRFLNKTSEVTFCPQFHHDKLSEDSNLSSRKVLMGHFSEKLKDEVLFPEQYFGNEEALSTHVASIKNELLDLCENGFSANYYKFENLIVHYAHNQKFHHNPMAMSSVLKIPIFSNYLLVRMLEITSTPMNSPFEQRFIEMSNTHWFKNYVASAKKMRSEVLKQQVVAR